jgi:hypothetical protein
MAIISRDEAITQLRAQFLAMTDDEHSMCRVAADRGVFCNGFARFSESELRERYWWIVRKQPNIDRQSLESIANLWQLAQQDVQQMPCACDVQTKLHDTCRGWHDFTNEQLATYYEQIVGKPVRVV